MCTPNQPKLHALVPHLISRCTRSAHEIGAECRPNADHCEAEVGELTRSGQEEIRGGTLIENRLFHQGLCELARMPILAPMVEN
jgi:hypothetical protein